MRTALIVCALACLLLPATVGAAAPTGYTPIGPPASLGAIASGADGTLYGTVASARILPAGAVWPPADYLSDPQPVANPALWRSRDHGHTWNAGYRAAPGVHFAVLAVSPADANTVYASEDSPRHRLAIERVDAARARAVPLPFASLAGVDGTGTAYGLNVGGAGDTLTRCPAAADTCSTVAIPQFVDHAVAVDPKSAGVLAAVAGNTTVAWIEISTDGGASWTRGANDVCDCARLAFAGPAPRTLYALAGRGLRLSHDAGATFAEAQQAPGDYSGLAVGSQPSATILNPHPYILDHVLGLATIEGAPVRAIELPAQGPPLAVDSSDANHIFFAQDGRSSQSWDAGASWTDLTDVRFGLALLDPTTTGAAGTYIYSTAAGTIWSSADSGATWRHVELDRQLRYVFVSRDDPRTAYVTLNLGGTLRTRDGGATWQEVAGPSVAGIVPGDPLHVYMSNYESLDGDETFRQLSVAEDCSSLRVLDDAASATGKRLACVPRYGDRTPQPISLPSTRPIPGLLGAPDAPGVFAVVADKQLGTVGKDGTWTSALTPGRRYGPLTDDASPLAAWPAAGGTVFYASKSSATWVRRGNGRWWRLQQAGHDLWLITVLDRTHALVRPAGIFGTIYRQGFPLAVIDLARPAVDPPVVNTRKRELVCAVPWSAAAATTSGYAWLRDGVRLRGATHGRYRPTARDRGHALSCRATASTDWGSVTLRSSNSARIPVDA